MPTVRQPPAADCDVDHSAGVMDVMSQSRPNVKIVCPNGGALVGR
jgi:hypothetical protein